MKISADAKFLIDVVKKAAKLINNDLIIKAKDDFGDLVTNFDTAIEKFIISKINEKYPDFDIVSEEFNSKNHITENCFVIDPIDGTVNFANGLPFFGIQVACVRNFKPCAAAIYLPKFKELYYADENGAFLNGKQLHLSTKITKSAPYIIDGKRRLGCMIKAKAVVPNPRCFDSSCFSFACMAKGQIAAVATTQGDIDLVWDYLPGEFIVTQAGATLTLGNKIHISSVNPELTKPLLEICEYREEKSAK